MPRLGLGLGAQNTNFELSYDPDARIYLAAVEAADGQGLESSVKNAINNFIVGCKADGIWNSIVASCIMAGARTVAGAIVPLRGNAPTNNNFVAGDYSRTLGLLGNDLDKNLATGYNNNDTTNFPQNDSHISCYVSESQTDASGTLVGNSTALGNFLLIAHSTTTNTIFRNRTSTNNRTVTLAPLGFQAISRDSASSLISRQTSSGGTISDLSQATASGTPASQLYGVFASGIGGSPTSARLSFYSIGKNLSISLLDSRVTTLMNEISSALAITTSRAFDSSGDQVGTTNTGDIPASWLESEGTVTSVIFANNNSVTSIGSSAFYNIGGLTTITIPNSVTSIGDFAFFGNGLTSITIPSSVTSIGDLAFGGCSSLASVTFTATSSVTNIGSYAFAYTSLTTITIPDSVTNIGSKAFYNCVNLTTATIGTGATTINSFAFYGCTSLATVSCYVAQSAFIGSDAFYNTASPLVIQARITDASWTAGVGLTFQGNTNVTVIKNL